jgi:hypothetical protein
MCTGQTGLRVRPVERFLKTDTDLGRSLEGCWGPAPDPRDLSLWAINRFCRMCWLALSERKQEWLPEGSHCAGRSPAQSGSENLSTASLRRSGCFPAEPCPPERHWRIRLGQAVVARLFEALNPNSPATALPTLQRFNKIVTLCWCHGSAVPDGGVSGQSANSAPRRFKTVMNIKLRNQMQYWNHRFPKPHPCRRKSALNSHWN